MSITNFSLPPKPEEDVQENSNDYSSFAPASEHLNKSPSLKKVALVVDREVNPPEKRCPHPEERRPRRSKKGCPGG